MREPESNLDTYRCPLQDGDQAATFLAWMDGTLAPEEAARLDRHATRCDSCREALNAHRSVWSALDDWEPEPVSRDFNRRLYAAIDIERARPWWKRAFAAMLPVPFRPAIPVAATGLLMIGAFLFRAPEPVDLENKQAGVLERVDVEQVDRSLDDLNLLRELDEELNVEPSTKSL